MAYFAIISEKHANLRVVRCHINIWALNELFGTTFFCDVGLGLRAKNGEQLKEFQLALPFRSTECQDLRKKLLDAPTATLIFGQPVQKDKNDVISFEEIIERRSIVLKPQPLFQPSANKSAEQEPAAQINNSSPISYEETSERRVSKTTVRLKPVAVHESTLDDKGKADYSLWNIKLNSAIEPKDTNPETYLRLRFPIHSFSRAWVKQGAGAIVDIRVSDVREGLAEKWESSEENIVDIESLNLFVIAPSTMKRRSASPELKYVRLLEGPPWEKYLNRRLSFLGFGRSKQVIYYWRSEKPITRNKPFMAFLDITAERNVTYLGLILVNVLILAAAWCLYRFFPTERAINVAREYWAVIAGAGLISSLTFVINKLAPYVVKVREIVLWIGRAPRWLNNMFYSKE
jgi:hypothetical protein